MTAAAPTKSKTIAPQQDWRAWVDALLPSVMARSAELFRDQGLQNKLAELITTPPHLLTRPDVLERVRELGADVDTVTLRHWEFEGLLPRPTRHWDPAVKGRPAFYPTWVIPLVFIVHELQRAGFSLREIVPRVRERAAGAMITAAFAEMKHINEARSNASHPGAAFDHDQWLKNESAWRYEIMLTFIEPVNDAIAVHARRYSRLLDKPIAGAIVTYYGEDGKLLGQGFPVDLRFANEPETF